MRSSRCAFIMAAMADRGRLARAATILFAILLPAFLAAPTSGSSTPLAASDWDTYKAAFLRSDGRIVDTDNRSVSHTESQGTGLLLAAAYGDQATFDTLWAWTVQHLRVRDDRLFAWLWQDDPKNPVPDRNNATDGDLLIGWALVRAGQRWSNPAYHAAAAELAREIRLRLLRRIGPYTLLLPGAVGFEKPGGILIVNPSYAVYPALAALKSVDPSSAWDAIDRSERLLIQRARFGRWGLPPDWLRLSPPARPGGLPKLAIYSGPQAQPYFGYNAIRIPLYLVWGKATRPILAPFHAFWSSLPGPFMPQFVNLLDDSLSTFDAPPGFRAIADLTAMAMEPDHIPQAVHQAPTAAQRYYSASLLMLTKLALHDRGFR